MLPRSKIRGHIALICFVCHIFCDGVRNLLITFKQWLLELWYFALVFLMTRPIHGYQHFFTLTFEFGLVFENLNLVFNLSIEVSARVFYISHESKTKPFDLDIWHVFFLKIDIGHNF